MNLTPAYYLGVMFSGHLDEKKVLKLLKIYNKLAEKNKRDIEIGFHPGYQDDLENMMKGSRKDLLNFTVPHGEKSSVTP